MAAAATQSLETRGYRGNAPRKETICLARMPGHSLAATDGCRTDQSPKSIPAMQTAALT